MATEAAVDNEPVADAVCAHAESVKAERIVCESSYYRFFLSAWSILEPETPLIDNWHIRYLCDLLQTEVERIAKREPKTLDLIINEPPRSAKSLVTTVCLCPWAWTRFPYLRFINVSYSERLAVDHCLASRRIVESEWYQRLWGTRFKVTSDQNQKAYFENNERGFRRACPSRGVTGSGADIMVWDDPQNPEMAESDVERENTKRVFGGTGYTRLNDQKVGLRVVIQQRLHEDDLTGHLLVNTGKYKHVCLPAELTDDASPPEVRQYYQDGLLFPARFGWNQLTEAKLPTNLGSYGYAAQMLQSPAPPEGGTFKRHWWRFWVPKGKTLPAPTYKDAEGKLRAATVVEIPDALDAVINSWDTAVEGGATHDFWAGGVWARVGASKFLLHQIREQMDYPDARKAVKALYGFWPNTGALLIEKASNGPAVKADLQREIPGIITIPTGKLSKEDRVHYSDTVPYAAQVEAGNVYLPHPALAPWVETFITEHAKFPKAAHDDQVDQSAQAINYLTQVRHVWSYYQPFNIAHHRKFDVRWTNALHYGALYLGKDMSISLLAALWDIADHKLYIYGCLLASQWSARGLATQMVRGMHLTEHRCQGIYGNDAMFKDDRRTISALLTSEMGGELRRRGYKRVLPILEPINYDRAGAIALANVLFAQESIVVHEAAQEASRQFAAWHIDNGAPADGYGLCEALTILVSELNRNARLKPPPKPPIDGYRPMTVAPTPPTMKERIESRNSWQAT